MPRPRIRVVLDTNILLSAILFGGVPGQILELWRVQIIELAISPELLAELISKLRFNFDFPSDAVGQWEQIIKENSIRVLPDYITRVCRDPDDDKLLDVSLSSKTKYLVTGDKDLLSLKKYHSVRILSPREFLAIFRK